MTKQEVIEKYKDLILTYGEVFIPEYGTITKDELNSEEINSEIKLKSIEEGETDG